MVWFKDSLHYKKKGGRLLYTVAFSDVLIYLMQKVHQVYEHSEGEITVIEDV